VGDLNTDGARAPFVGRQVERSLGPKRYHDRLPVFAKIVGENTIEARQLTQEAMDADIAYANAAGIHFWAFYRYAVGSGLDTARNLYASSTEKGALKFAYVIDNSHTPAFDFSLLIDDLSRRNYERVTGDRPLIFVFTDTTPSYSRAELQTLDNFASSAGLPEPFIVVLNYNSRRAAELATLMDADAISAYVTYLGGGGSYKKLMSADRKKWEAHKATGKPVIPWVTAGWDPRPRIENPVSWIAYDEGDWTEPGSAEQIAMNLQRALTWLHNNPEATPAPVVLIYAWNEFDEGGWVAPTMAEGTKRLDAIRDVLMSEPAAR
jgi:hypothetical protein